MNFVNNLNHQYQGLPEEHQPEIPAAFRRFLRNDQLAAGESKPKKPVQPIMKATVRPNPFLTTITLDVTCEQSKHIIVRMTDSDGKIVKMFSWYVVKGTNVTAIHELTNLGSGDYTLDIVDSEGELLFSTQIRKN